MNMANGCNLQSSYTAFSKMALACYVNYSGGSRGEKESLQPANLRFSLGYFLFYSQLKIYMYVYLKLT